MCVCVCVCVCVCARVRARARARMCTECDLQQAVFVQKDGQNSSDGWSCIIPTTAGKKKTKKYTTKYRSNIQDLFVC